MFYYASVDRMDTEASLLYYDSCFSLVSTWGQVIMQSALLIWVSYWATSSTKYHVVSGVCLSACSSAVK